MKKCRMSTLSHKVNSLNLKDKSLECNSSMLRQLSDMLSKEIDKTDTEIRIDKTLSHIHSNLLSSNMKNKRTDNEDNYFHQNSTHQHKVGKNFNYSWGNWENKMNSQHKNCQLSSRNDYSKHNSSRQNYWGTPCNHTWLTNSEDIFHYQGSTQSSKISKLNYLSTKRKQ